ncbi:MAG TPA: RIP metalloprotease RseP [Firmicutes bacterium]|nr:RIP metalloprotease RseP [Candidatus Fermentithermobacillaceae bacterium]
MQQAVLAVVFLGILVMFHEIGHFVAGRILGVFIHEFSIGFGPAILSWVRGETRYSLRIIPLGGYVRFAGEEGSGKEEDNKVPRERLLYSQSPGRRAFIVFSGPLMNLIVASVAFFLVFSFIGIARPTTVVGEVVPGYPAEKSGVQPGDRVLKVEDVTVVEWQDMVKVVQRRAGIPTRLSLQRGSQTIEVTVVPVEMGGQGVIGVKASLTVVRLGLVEGLVAGVKETVLVSVAWARGIFAMISGKVAPEVTGPVGISQLLGEAARMGLSQLFYLVGALSANLGLINLLPVPALDGSRLLFAGLEAIRGKPIDPEKESFVHFVGFFLLMILFVVITYKDILRLIR